MEGEYSQTIEEWREYRSCGRKKLVFHDKKAAKVRARDLNKLYGYKTDKLRPYKCDYCGNYHIGHDKFLHFVPQK